jgi:hypothetical protein
LLFLLLLGEGPLVPLLDLAPVCEGDLNLLVTVAAVTGTREPLAKASLLLLLLLGVNVVVGGMVRRDGLLLDGAGERDLQERCLGSCLGGDDTVLAPGVLDLLGGGAPCQG